MRGGDAGTAGSDIYSQLQMAASSTITCIVTRRASGEKVETFLQIGF